MLEALLKYGRDKNGTYNVKKTFKIIENGIPEGVVLNIGVWLNTQRENREKGNLRSDRESLLQVKYFMIS